MLALMSKLILDDYLVQKLGRKRITSLVIVPHADLARQYLHWIEHMIRVADSQRSTDTVV